MVSGSTTSTWSIGGELGLAERALHGEMAIEREFRGLGVERLAVVEFHARPQLDGDRLAVGRGLVRERELRHDVELLVDVEQLVAERGEHDAADIGARERRIENVGVLGKADAQRGLGRGRRRRARSSAAAAAKRKVFMAILPHPEPKSLRRPQVRRPRKGPSRPMAPAAILRDAAPLTAPQDEAEIPAPAATVSTPPASRTSVERAKAANSAPAPATGRAGGAANGGSSATRWQAAAWPPRQREAAAALDCGSARSRRGSGYESGSPAAD